MPKSYKKLPVLIQLLIVFTTVGIPIALFLNLPQVVKIVGAPLLFIPDKLGIIEPIGKKDVTTILLIKETDSTVVEINQPGNFAFYTNETDLLLVETRGAILWEWLSLKKEESTEFIDLLLVDRGLRPYDTVFAPGRPFVTFEINEPGRYLLTYPEVKDKNQVIALVPDYIGENEQTVILLYILQLAIIIGTPGVFFTHRYWGRRKEFKTSQIDRRPRANTFFEVLEDKDGERSD